MPPPTRTAPPAAGHAGPALQAFYQLRRGRCPHRPAITHRTSKLCHCEPVTDVTGVANRTPHASHSLQCFRRGRRLPTVVPADSRPLSWPPIGALPRNRLASPATGGASPISPTTRRQRTASPQKSCHCEERSDVAIRPPHAPHPQPMRRGGVLPRPSPTSHPHKKPAAAQIAPLPVSVCFYLPPQKDTVSCAGFWQALMRSTYSTGPSPW